MNGINIKKNSVFQIGSRIPQGTSGSVLFVDSNGKLAQDNSNFYWDDTNNRLGIGTTSPTSRLHGVTTLSAATGDEVAYELDYTTNKLTSGNDTGLKINMTDTASPGNSFLQRWQVGGTDKAYLLNSGSLGINFISSLGANQTMAINTASYSAANMVGIDIFNAGSITSTSGYFIGLSISPTYNQVASTASNTDLLITRTETAVGSGAQYLIDAKVGGVSKFNISNTGQGYFAGNVGIGTTSPTSRLHLSAGSATANTAPLQFTSGVLETVARAGVVEFLTDDWYATITTGSARKKFVLDDGTNLTSGVIPVATTNGRLTNLTAQAHETDAKADYTTGDLDTEAEIITAINSTNAKINALLVKLENLKLLASS